jgi:hypothetical protein
VDEEAGLPEDQVFMPPVRRLRSAPAAPPIDDDELGFGAAPVPIHEDDVSIDELLDRGRTEEKRSIDIRIARLASLLGIAAAAIAVLILVFAAGTDIASVFRSLPGS